MHHRVPRLHGAFFKFRTFFSEELIALLLVLLVFSVPAGAAERFTNRSLLMNSVTPGATTSYQISLDYVTPEPVGSLDMRFCISPIPYDPCVTPEGLDITEAALSAQQGETGFAISYHDDKRIVLSRTPAMISEAGVSGKYTLSNIVNPTDISESFSIRLTSHSSTDASGPHINFGSIKGQVGDGITIETQVPPMLIFCAARTVEIGCTNTDGTYFTDMGNLDEMSTLTAQSQMAAGTNASAGFVITVNGSSMTAGTNVIDELNEPSDSQVGTRQFGINLVENPEVGVGQNPEGEWANAQPTSNYGQPDVFKYTTGDVIAESTNVSLMKKFTVSYIVNVDRGLRAGVYTTTINFIASGRF